MIPYLAAKCKNCMVKATMRDSYPTQPVMTDIILLKR